MVRFLVVLSFFVTQAKVFKELCIILKLQSLTHLRMSISLPAVDLNGRWRLLIYMEVWMMDLVVGVMVVVSTEVFLPSSSIEVAALGFCVNQVKMYLATICQTYVEKKSQDLPIYF